MVRINLLPVRVSKKKEAGKQQVLLFVILLIGGLILNYLWAHQRAGVLKDHRTQVERKKAEIAQLERIIGEVKDIRTQQEQLKQKLDVLERLKAARSGPVKMLDELATLTPKRLWLKTLSEKGGTSISFAGTAATIDDVSAFMGALKTSKHFTDVELKKTSALAAKGSVRLVDFSINAGVTYGGPPAPAAPPPAGGVR